MPYDVGVCNLNYINRKPSDATAHRENYVRLLCELTLRELAACECSDNNSDTVKNKGTALNHIFVLNLHSLNLHNLHSLTHLQLASRCAKLGKFQTVLPKVLSQLPKA